MNTNILKKTNGSALVPQVGGWVDQLINDSLTRLLPDPFSQGMKTMMPVNIRETETAFEMQLVAPGLSKEELSLNVNEEQLTISYEAKTEQKDTNTGRWLRQEYRPVSFTRTFNLDETIDATGVTASYNNGILHLVLPKKEQAQRLTRNIEIS
jgi:HSP20 family protein